MNVTEFAERVVFGDSLEDKLLVPGRLTRDTRPVKQSLVNSLITPGRPRGLEMRHGRIGNVQPPSDDKLENEQARGQLLHFLANHELLATELMALVLLKFPDAPHAFRQGVLVTLQEEQAHTRMYIRRMRECGVEFGSYPLSGQFWRIVEPMQSPLDFVARLSLTFEQANLDYSLHFASIFRQIGDQSTADVLQKIYEDEIGHVQHGLHWFRQWKNPQHSDWEAYQESLDFPMSPQRGRGPRGAFNRAGRVQAGLTDDFIDAIEVFRQSRGRPPTVRWFDPAAESELAGEMAPHVTPLLDQLGKDLELVMAGVAKQDDVVLVRRMPSRAIRKHLIDAGFELPEFIRFDDRNELNQRKLHDFEPWAWTPENHEIARPLSAVAHQPPPSWHTETCDLFRKSFGAECLSRWIRESDPASERRLEIEAPDPSANELPDWFTPATSAGVPIFEMRDVSAALSQLAERGVQQAIFKQDLAASGRGQRRLPCQTPLSAQDIAWLQSIFSTTKKPVIAESNRGTSQTSTESDRGEVAGVVEPELDRLLDLSFLWHFARNAKAPTYLGWTRPWVAPGRKYVGTRLGTALTGCDQRLTRFLLTDRGARLQTVVNWLEPRVTQELLAREFTGYFGIDALVCQDVTGALKVKPLVELNPRMTMGHVALRLKRRLAPGTEAEFRVLTISQWRTCHRQLEQLPLECSPDGRWRSGVVWLGEVDDTTKLVPLILIGETAMELAGFSATQTPSVS